MRLNGYARHYGELGVRLASCQHHLMTTKLIPHTTAWFEAVIAFDPDQAGHTANVIKREGRSDVCGVCGDDPASDVELDPKQAAPGAVTTLRLCNDCLSIRRINGERFTPLR